MGRFSFRPLTFLITGFCWLLLSSLVGLAILIGLAHGTPLPSWLRVGSCACRPYRWYPAAHDRRPACLPIGHQPPERPNPFELPSRALCSPECRHNRITRWIRTREPDDRRHGWDCRDWSRRLYGHGCLAVHATQPYSAGPAHPGYIDSHSSLYSLDWQLASRWPFDSCRNTTPMRGFFICI